MAKITVNGDALTISTNITVEQYEKVMNYSPDLLKIKDEEGNEISKQMEFEITEKPENTSIIYFMKPSNWNKARIYIYDDSGNELKVKSQWPGEEMKYVSEDLYMYVLPNEFENAKVLFNDGDKQIPAENEEGFTIKYGEIRI